MEFPAEEPSSVVGRVLDPPPTSECQHEWLPTTRGKLGNDTVKHQPKYYLKMWRSNIQYLMEQNLVIQLLLLLVVKQLL